MKILQDLGINGTILFQLILFLICYVALSKLLFKPYLEAYHERKRRTEGNEDFAERIIQEAREIRHQYEQKARKVNHEYRSIFDQTKTKALREHDRVVAEAKAEAQRLIDQAQEEVALKLSQAQNEVEKEISSLGSAIATNLIGKDISV